MTLSKQQIKCPECGTSISIDDVLTHQISEQIRGEFQAEQRAREEALLERQRFLDAEQERLDRATRESASLIEKAVAEKIAAERKVIMGQAKEAALQENEKERKMLEEALEEKNAKLQEANEKELMLRKERNRLEEERQSFELEKQRELDEERAKISEEAGRKATEETRFVIAQLQKQLSDATKAKDDLARKLEQGSQQTQGEVLELELETSLRSEFLHDEIVPVPKGVKGADIIQRVFDRGGRLAGQIVWESKNTKVWSEGWVQKLKEDQRLVKADIAVIVSSVLPQGMTGFALRDGVWVCEMRLALALAGALRITLESVTREKTLSVGKNEKMEVLYAYLTGVEFRQRVEAIVEAFTGMSDGLRKERLAYEKLWAEREKQINKVIVNTVGMYGDLSGYVALPQIKALELGDGDEQKTLL
ncbi:MAG: DUF2130 domain-containing protein [Candidatus Moranbacteria bacterium]|nr:DUF2130 domain-containing protein [Candidatus Moranbacteria bacterium]